MLPVLTSGSTRFTKLTDDNLQLLAHLVEQTSDVLTAADLDFKPLTWNRAAEVIYGITAEEAIGSDLRSYIDIEYASCSRQEVRASIARDGEWRGEAFFTRPTDEKQITVLICFKLLKDEYDNSLGYLISAIDITERKKSELRLKESETRFRDMADSAPVMIWMSDEHNKVTYFNRKWIDFAGQGIARNAGNGWSTFVHPEDFPKAKKIYDRAFENKDQVTIVYRLLSANGSYKWVHDVSVPRFLSDGTFLGYIGSVVDIEDQKQKEEQLRYQATMLENVSDVIITTNLKHHVLSWNKAAEQMFDTPAETMIGKFLYNEIDFDFGITKEELAAQFKTRDGWKGEVAFTDKQGEKKFLLFTTRYMKDDSGTPFAIMGVGRDITERKKIEEQLLKSEQFYRTLIADSLDGTLLLNAEGNITFCSSSVKHVLGYEPEDILNKSGFGFVHPEDVSWALSSFQKELVENPEVKSIVIRLLHKQGHWVWCMVRGHNLLKNSYIHSIVVYFHDDTLRKQASDALKESEKRFRNLIRDLQVGVFLQDPKGNILISNKAMYSTFDITEEELVDNKIWELFSDVVNEDGTPLSKEERPSYRAMKSKQLVTDVVMGVKRSGSHERTWILITADPILDENGDIRHIISSFTNITERKKLEEKLLADKLKHQRQLTQATIDGQEKERTEIGKELHDNIGQQLTTIKLFLDLAKTTADESTNEMVSLALKGVSDVINEVRAISKSLVPSTLKDLGLIESINELIDSFRRTQLMAIHFDHFNFHENPLPENQQLTLFRITQEQLNNIVKHSRARNVWIRIGWEANRFFLQIKDDGIGMDLRTIKKGLGFINIKNRAELFGGKKEITSQPGKGCTLRVSIPQRITG
jgi:PAS domain S-box-containing protein